MRIYHHWPPGPPGLHFECPRLILSLECSWILTLIRIQLFALMRIQIQLPKTMLIRIRNLVPMYTVLERLQKHGARIRGNYVLTVSWNLLSFIYCSSQLISFCYFFYFLFIWSIIFLQGGQAAVPRCVHWIAPWPFPMYVHFEPPTPRPPAETRCCQVAESSAA
jgi:hypothetical protein